MMITKDDLRERWEWSYDQKIDHSLFVVDTFIHRTNGKCFMVLDTDAKSAVLMDLVWRIDKSICGVYPEQVAEHIANYGGFPIYPARAIDSRGQMKRYLERGHCATFTEDGDKATEAYPLAIWKAGDIERYITDHRNLKSFIRNR